MVEKVTVLALCRFSMGIRIHSFLSSLIFKSIMSHGHEYVSNLAESGKFSEYYLL
jgi:hypothetical protein